MDIGSTVTVRYQLKRGNYAVDCNDRIDGDASIDITSKGGLSVNDLGTSYIYAGQGRGVGVGSNYSNDRQERSCLCEEDCVQGEPLQHRLVQQIEWCSWSLAVTLGKTRVVNTQTNIRSTQVCASSLRNLVQGVRVPSRKELVLNEST